MIEHAKERLTRMLANLNAPLKGRRVFLCLHKQLEPNATTFAPSFEAYSIDHWGNVDGRNDWQDFDAAILLGLPYRPDTWAIDMMQAVRQVEAPGEQLKIGAHQKRNQIKQTLQNRQIAASIIQAINRIRCRRVVDEDGNCAEADVYIVLPRNKIGNDVLARIASEMPGIQVMPWDFDLDGEARNVRKAHYVDPVINCMKNQPPGEIELTAICEKLTLGKNAKKDMQKDLKDPNSLLSSQLAQMGVFYHSTGRGRGARSYLFKR